MPGITLPNNVARLRQTFARYAEINGRDREQLAMDQARKLAVELYNQTAAIAPTKAEIAADVIALGWKIPKWFSEGGVRGWRFGRGKAPMWGAVTKTGRKKATPSERPTLEQMEAVVIKIRTNHAKFMAIGWIPAILALGGSVKASSGSVDPSRGGIFLRRSPGVLEIVMWMRAPQAKTVLEKKQVVPKAFAVRIIDMWAYIIPRLKRGLPNE